MDLALSIHSDSVLKAKSSQDRLRKWITNIIMKLIYMPLFSRNDSDKYIMIYRVLKWEITNS